MSKGKEQQKVTSTATIPNKSNHKTNSTNKTSQSNQLFQQNQAGQRQNVNHKSKQTLLRSKTNKQGLQIQTNHTHSTKPKFPSPPLTRSKSKPKQDPKKNGQQTSSNSNTTTNKNSNTNVSPSISITQDTSTVAIKKEVMDAAAEGKTQTKLPFQSNKNKTNTGSSLNKTQRQQQQQRASQTTTSGSQVQNTYQRSTSQITIDNQAFSTIEISRDKRLQHANSILKQISSQNPSNPPSTPKTSKPNEKKNNSTSNDAEETVHTPVTTNVHPNASVGEDVQVSSQDTISTPKRNLSNEFDTGTQQYTPDPEIQQSDIDKIIGKDNSSNDRQEIQTPTHDATNQSSNKEREQVLEEIQKQQQKNKEEFQAEQKKETNKQTETESIPSNTPKKSTGFLSFISNSFTWTPRQSSTKKSDIGKDKNDNKSKPINEKTNDTSPNLKNTPNTEKSKKGGHTVNNPYKSPMKRKFSPGKANTKSSFSNYNPSIVGATPEEKAKRARAKETTFIVDITIQLPELYGHNSRNKKWDVTQLLPIVKDFYQTALRHDSKIGLAPVTDHDIIEHDIAYGKQMCKLFEDQTVKSFTDARILKYFYLANPRTLYDKNRGVVYSKVKIRTGKRINKDKLLAYTRPIYE